MWRKGQGRSFWPRLYKESGNFVIFEARSLALATPPREHLDLLHRDGISTEQGVQRAKFAANEVTRKISNNPTTEPIFRRGC